MSDTTILSTANSAMIDYPVMLQASGGDTAISYSAQDIFRQVLDAVFSSGGRVTFAGFKVSQRAAGANFSVDVSAGYYVITGDTDPTNQGKYLIKTNAAVNVATPAAPVSGTRVHRLVAQVLDKRDGGASSYGWQFWLREDTGSGTPAIPGNAGSLATISIAAGQANVQNANITDTSGYASHSHGLTGITYLKDFAVGAATLYTGSPTGAITYTNVNMLAYVNSGHRYRVRIKVRYFVDTDNAYVEFAIHKAATASDVTAAKRIGNDVTPKLAQPPVHSRIIETEFNATTDEYVYFNLGAKTSSGGITITKGESPWNDLTWIELIDLGDNTSDRVTYTSGA